MQILPTQKVSPVSIFDRKHPTNHNCVLMTVLGYTHRSWQRISSTTCLQYFVDYSFYLPTVSERNHDSSVQRHDSGENPFILQLHECNLSGLILYLVVFIHENCDRVNWLVKLETFCSCTVFWFYIFVVADMQGRIGWNWTIHEHLSWEDEAIHTAAGRVLVTPRNIPNTN